MINRIRVLLIISICFIFMLLHSCDSNGNGNSGGEIISSFNSSRSHKTGQNCMNCHVQGGGGDGFFSVAGTVYEKDGNNPLPNAIVRIYPADELEGDPIAVIEVDGRGNFYTTENIVFEGGLTTSVEGPTTEIFMESTITNGSCNSCHGQSTGSIWAE